MQNRKITTFEGGKAYRIKIMGFKHDKIIGILGGGQLGKMLCQAGSRWNLNIHVLDKPGEMPARNLCEKYIEGDFTRYSDVMAFGKSVDILTIEIEKVNLEALFELEKQGVEVYPAPRVLAIIQDKGLQKDFYSEHNLPTSSYALFKDKEEILSAVKSGKLSLPFVQKARKDGYDGRGVQVINSEEDLKDLFDSPSVVEVKVNIAKELAVIVVRNNKGETITYPTVEMVFDADANLVDYLHCPASIDKKTAQALEELSHRVMDAYDFAGILAIEYFLDTDGNILINEVAPRTHNSGHHTIEASNCSQFEHHLRAILNLPLRQIEIIQPSIMVNLLGEDGHAGRAVYKGVEDILKQAYTFIHLYGKSETRPFRKMGHITRFIHRDEDPAEVSRQVKSLIKVVAE